MATDAVTVFAPSFGIDDCKSFQGIELKESVSLDYKNGYQPGTKRYGMPLDELEAAKEGDFLVRVKKSKENEESSKENEDTAINGTNKMSSELKKKRNSRKRNRSDMSPEELRRLRERERKAQQSRRDRIRAQKRQNQAWHDDDAAWEAFLDQTDDDKSGNKTSGKHSSSIPSMVCQIEPSHDKEDLGDGINDEKEFMDEVKEPRLETQNSLESESNTGSNNSLGYSSDDSNQDSLKDDNSKRSSHRQFLPSEELEKLRKRERDAKRIQRERCRQASSDSGSHSKDKLSDEESNDYQQVKNKIEEIMKEEPKHHNHQYNEDELNIHTNQYIKDEPKVHNHRQENEPIERKRSHIDMENEPIERKHSHIDIDRHHAHDEKRHHHPHKPHYLSSPPHHQPNMFHHKISPHSHHNRDYFPSMYAPDSHHHRHYSPTDRKHFVSDVKHHHPDNRHENHHYHHHHDRYERQDHHKHYYPTQFVPIIHSQPDSGNTSPIGDVGKAKHSISPQCEKKKMISRNVDRKKLSEEELEELRRRERDYQRERRARIRMEKAKTQAQQERFHHKGREVLPPNYYHHSDIYRHHMHQHPQERSMDIISRYEPPEHFNHRDMSPTAPEFKKTETTDERSEELKVNIPESDSRDEQLDNKPEADLLQVVPKTRDCEEKYIPPHATSSPVEEEPPKSKKSLLESICSSLKKESSEWTDNEESRLVVDLEIEDMDKDKEKESMDSEENLAKLKEELMSKDFRVEQQQSEDQKMRDKMTEDQLERRRRSNREAQRRRRARLKMQGNVDDRLEFDHHGDDIEKEKRLNGERHETRNFHMKSIKSRPDSLYMQNMHDVYPAHRNSYHHKDKTHEHIFLRDKYGHHLPEPFTHRNKHAYHIPHHHGGMDVDSSPRHPHYLYEPLRSPDHRDHPAAPHRPHHLPRHHDKLDREYERSPHDGGATKLTNVPPMKEKEKSPSPPLPPSETTNRHNSECKDDSFGNENEPALKLSGRKRKQYAPRKLASSANTTPDEMIDVVNQVVILNDMMDNNDGIEQEEENIH